MSASLNRKLKQAHDLLRAGDAARARSQCELALREAPRNPDALTVYGVCLIAEGRPVEALPPLRQVLASQPRHGVALEYLGLAHLMLAEFDAAESALARAAKVPGAPASVHMRLGIAHLEQGRTADAVAAMERALTMAPQDTDCLLNLGRALAQSGDAAGASARFEEVLRIAPDHVDAVYNLGVLALSREDVVEARRWFERALAAAPGHPEAMVSLGVVLQRQALLSEAEAQLRRALALRPGSAAAGTELGRTLALQGRLDEAREAYRAALRADAGFGPAHEGLASSCLALGRTSEAIEHLRAALQADSGNADALSALAGALFEAGALDEAEDAARRAAETGAAAAGCVTLANIALVRGRLDDAIATLESGHARTGASILLGMLTYQLRQACDWPKWQAAWSALEPELARGAPLGSAFWLLCEPTTALQQLDYSRRWAEQRFGAISVPPPAAAEHAPGARLRVGYLSSDFQEHAVGYLIVEALELHDRERFEIFAYSHGPQDDTPMRRRFQSACEHFIDISRVPDDSAAQRIRADELDLLVDLKGYTVGDRLAIMARRPCAVQAAWLGYPGTTGAAFIDYLIADAYIVPPALESAYSERVVRLPHCYQPNDRRREVAATASRPEYGLPEDGFVYCCFNQANKIGPEMFAVWMRLLARVPGSVLWLLAGDALARANLIAAARGHGVAEERIVFAPKLPNAQHLARYRAADLALDTFPYTSHTTLSDALWCGCPAVALVGETFAARVSGSILTAAGLPELVTHSLEEYEALALRLAGDRKVLKEVHEGVARARNESPLFDTPAFTRALEEIFLRIAGR